MKNIVISVIFLLVVNISFAEKSIYLSEEKYLELQNKEKTMRAELLTDPVNSDLHDDLALLLSDIGKFDEALNEVNIAIELDPGNHYYIAHRASIYMDLKETDNAIRDFKNVLEISPNEMGAFINLCIIYRDKGEYKKSIECGKNALSVERNGFNYYNLALVYMLNGEYEEARENLKAVFRFVHPGDYLDKMAKMKLGEIKKLEKEKDDNEAN